jgi:hypothetical protein
MVHLDATVFPNGTIWNNKTTHVGQGFFDMNLIDLVEATSPYTENKQEMTSNAADYILRQEAETTDPFFEYVLLGDDVTDGILAWVRFGINTTYTRTVQAAAMRYEEGGQMNTNNPGAGFFPGGFPSGFPSGFPTSLFAPPTGTGAPGMWPPWSPSGSVTTPSTLETSTVAPPSSTQGAGGE